MLTRSQRTVRMGATAAVLLLLAAGTMWGDDEHFPFGPFRMYSTRNDPNGTVNVVKIRARTATGEVVSLSTRTFGLRPAEVNGQITRHADDSVLAAELARAYESFEREPPLEKLWLLHGFHQLRNSRPVDYWEEVLGTWTGP
jgi:class 3 adenylate cyclase